MKTYFDILATYPDQLQLARAIDAHIAHMRDPYSEKLRVQFENELDGLKLNRSQESILFDCVHKDFADAADFLRKMASYEIDFDFGDDLPGYQYDAHAEMVIGANQFFDVDGALVTTDAAGAEVEKIFL